VKLMAFASVSGIVYSILQSPFCATKIQSFLLVVELSKKMSLLKLDYRKKECIRSASIPEEMTSGEMIRH
jgi:hypothetical protein